MKIFVVFSFFLFPLFVFSQGLHFYREDLTFEIKNGFFIVDGIYNFCNNGEKEIQQVLFYPFPADRLYGAVDSIYALDMLTGTQAEMINKTGKGFFFKIGLLPYGTGKYQISYRQRLLKNKAEYILLTTQKWGLPFETAFYKLITPADVRITSMSYNPDSTKQKGDRTIYYWSKKNFMPEKNMIFYFDR